MDIKYYDISYKDVNLVTHLAPVEVLATMALPKHRGIMAVDARKKLPCGLLLYSYGSELRFDIEWINVFETYRFHGIGGGLMIEAYNRAYASTLPMIGFRLIGEAAGDEIRGSMESFASDWGFTGGAFTYGDYEFSLNTLIMSEAFMKNIPTSGITTIINDDDIDLMRYLKQHADELLETPLFDINDVQRIIDRSLSVIHRGSSGIDAVLLVQRIRDKVYPVVLHSTVGENMYLSLMFAACSNLKAVEADSLVCHVAYSKKASDIVYNLMPKTLSVPTYMWTSESDFYERDKVIAEQMASMPEGDLLGDKEPTSFIITRYVTWGEL